MTGKTDARVAIVGFGPRGLAALEALVTRARAKGCLLEIDIFDPFACPGAGPNYDPDQSEDCLLNIPVRSLNIDPPAFLARHIAAFQRWSPVSHDPEDYPPRAQIGAYFHARYLALQDAVQDEAKITHTAVEITGLENADGGWRLTSQGDTHGPYDEVLFTLGQPESAPDPQLGRWMDHADQHGLDLLPAYPANELIAAAKDWRDETVAIRGLGLSTFDVLRMLTTGLGGTFKDGKYLPSGREPCKILPFSLDGLPPAPKPATAAMDLRFDPTEAETRLYQQALSTAFSDGATDALETLCTALVAPSCRILSDLGGVDDDAEIRLWLAFERDHAGAQEYLSALDTLETGIAMSSGQAPPSVGYTIAQVWRKWEPLTRNAFNAATLDPATASAIVEFDEKLKRYSAGPPVSSSRELLALIESGLVSLCTVDDPAILLSPQGWHLSQGDDTLSASVMINAVLPPPDASKLSAPLITTLLDRGIIGQLPKGRGLLGTQAGQLCDASGKLQHGLSALGRLALGNVIAVDSLHDCFGDTTTDWAAGVVRRLSS